MTDSILKGSELVGELKAKAWQSASRRNAAGSLSNPQDHVCWRAASYITALEGELRSSRSQSVLPSNGQPEAEPSAADHFLAFCARHFGPVRRHDLTDAELLSIVENHPALHDLTRSPLPPSPGQPEAEGAGAFTPGPWITETTAKFVWIGTPKASGAKVANVVTAIACDMLTEKAEAIVLANARLIAAVPDGLAAASQTYLRLLKLHDIRHTIQPELCALRDFIAKASGRAPQDVQDEFEAKALGHE